MSWLSHILRKAEEMEGKYEKYNVDYEPFESLDDAIRVLGLSRVTRLVLDYQARLNPEREPIPHLDEPCGDSRCATCGDYATSYRNPIPLDVITQELGSRGELYFKVDGNPRLFGTLKAETLSCTGPFTLTLEFKRDIFHTLDVGPEKVTIVLAEAVE